MIDLEDQLYDAALDYKRVFGSTPTIVNLNPLLQQKATQLLRKAIATKRPFKDDNEWFRALGVEPPPADALI